MVLAEKAARPTPSRMKTMVNSRPAALSGWISPKPTVVRVITDMKNCRRSSLLDQMVTGSADNQEPNRAAGQAQHGIAFHH